MTTISSTFVHDTGLTGVNTTVFEHNQSCHSFYSSTIGKWFVVAPRNNSGWSIWRQDSEADNGYADIGVSGSVIHSDLAFHTSVAWDDTNDKLWVVRSQLGSTKPHLHGFSLSAGVFTQDYDFILANDPSGLFSTVNSTGWSSCPVISLTLDINNLPMLAALTGNGSRDAGIHMGYCTAANYASITTGTWGNHRLENNTGLSSTDSQVEIVSYNKSGTDYIGILAAQENFDGIGGDRWGFYYASEAGRATLGNWANETMLASAQMTIDNHISVAVDSDKLFVVAKSGAPDNNLNLFTYTQGGAASGPHKIDNGDAVPQVRSSRGCLVIDTTARLGYVLKQEEVVSPNGNTYLKTFDLDAADLSAEFDPTVNGELLIDDPTATESLKDPVRPAHNVDSTMGGFPVFAFQSTADVVYWSFVTISSGSGGITLTVDSGNYLLTGAETTLKASLNITTTEGAYSLTGSTANLLIARKLLTETGSYNLTGTGVTLTVSTAGEILVIDSGVYSLSGTETILKADLNIKPLNGNYSYAGANTPTRFNSKIHIDSDTYALTGTGLNLFAHYGILTQSAIYSVAGALVALKYSGDIAQKIGVVTSSFADNDISVGYKLNTITVTFKG